MLPTSANPDVIFELIYSWGKQQFIGVFLSILLFPLMNKIIQFVCVKVLQPSQPNGIMSSAVSLSNHTFTGQA